MKKNTLTLSCLFLIFSSFAQISNYVPTNGLVGWWPFNGNANDASGNGNNGTVNGATLTTDRFGVADKAYSFDGTSSKITVQDANILDLTNTASISGWYNMNNLNFDSQTNSYQGRLVDKCTVGGWDGYMIDIGRSASTSNSNYCNTSFVKLRGLMGACIPQLNTPCYNSQNLWIHFVVTFSSGLEKIYINGQMVANMNCSNTSLPVNNLPLVFGYPPNSTNPAYTLNGKLDDIGIWNRALTACEIQDLYNAQLNSLSVSGGPDQQLCQGQSTSLFGTGASTYSWSNNVQNGVGFVPNVSTSYIVTGTDANGCIGTDTVSVIVNSPSSSTQSQTALDSYTWPVNGQTYIQSGTYTGTLVNAAGCDSVVTLNLTLSFTGIDEMEYNSAKKLVKITDLNGKETPFRKNTVLLFIYEDGTVERVLEAD